MSEITIKVNKTMLFVVVALIVGLGGGYLLSGMGAENGNANNPTPAQLGNNPSPSPSPSPSPQVELTKDDHIRGAKNPKVTLVEYSDFQCPYCKRFHPTMTQLLAEFPNDVAWVYRHYPLSFHQNAQVSAEASECANDQGKFWEFADTLFEKGQSDGRGLAKADLQKYAGELGLNVSKFNNCLDSGKYTAKVNADLASGTVAGVTGTPGTIMITKDGKTQLISGAVPYATLKATVEAAL